MLVNSLADLTLDEERGLAVARLSGEIDAANADELRAQIVAALEGRSDDVVVDLTRVKYIDSSGIKALLDADHEIADRNQRARYVVVEGSPIGRIVSVTGLDGILAIDGSVLDAVAALGASTD